MKLILHIGHPKTGTTSIQHWCAHHASALRESGIFYPKIADFPNHSILSVPFYETRVPLEYWNQHGRDHRRVASIALECWDSLARQIEHDESRVLLLSGEHFFKIDNVAALTRHLAATFPRIAEIDVVVYLRRHSLQFLSRMQQQVKASWRIPEPSNLSYYERLEKWRRLGRLTIRECDTTTLYRGDVVWDVLRLVGFDPATVNAPPVSWRNESMSAEGMQIVQEFRRFAHPNDDNCFTPETNRLLRAIECAEETKGKFDFFTRPRLHDYISRAIDEDAAHDRQQLDEEFGFRFIDLVGQTPDAAFDLRTLSLTHVADLVEIDQEKVKVLRTRILKQLLSV